MTWGSENMAIGGVHCWFRGTPSYLFLEWDAIHHSSIAGACGRNYLQTHNVIINIGHIFSFKNGYICSKKTDDFFYNRRH